ncbi:hypothetical protein [Fodinicola acaciae]|uniref:hypothetical protein n=1 Tax=Fodinicola acaciae TaxID=2681555 RepID=UPI0013D5A482|nr:hypothetical protein [Fodinicola acaciae]
MTAPEGPVAAVTGKKMLRRRVLTAIGAAGVAVSAGLFGRPNKAAAASASPADAGRPACCNLYNYPPNTSYDYCHAHAGYIWYCTASGGFLHCSCCETPGDVLSAADCRYN